MGYRRTVQEAVIQIVAEKSSATAAISGKFSTEGLASMANGVDVKVKLAQAMASMDKSSGNRLQEMFDVNAAGTNGGNELDGYKPMLLYAELIAGTKEAFDKAVNEMDKDEFDSMFHFIDYMAELATIDVTGVACMKEDMDSLKGNDLFEESILFSTLDEVKEVQLSEKELKIKKKKVSAGQLDIFSLL